MGSSSYCSTSSRTREKAYKSMSKEEIFTARGLNDRVNPFGLKIRESRDSEAHPNSVPIIIAFDVTGSMGKIPHNLVTNHFSNMMEHLITNNVPDASICFVAIGDHYSDQAPLQVGQFESGDIELTADLTSIWLEGGGGGQKMESYMLTWLFAARHTITDAFEKRGQKGYLFTIGDEWNHPKVESKIFKSVLGYKEVPSDVLTTTLLEEVKEKWEVFHIHCNDGCYGEDVSNRWKELLGKKCVTIDSSKIADYIATTVSSSQEMTNNQSINKENDSDTSSLQFIK